MELLLFFLEMTGKLVDIHGGLPFSEKRRKGVWVERGEVTGRDWGEKREGKL